MTGPTPADAPAAADAWHWVALSLALLAAYWPAFGAGYLQDDYVLLAAARLLEDPGRLFLQDSMPGGGGFYFRPLTLGVWWLLARLSGASPLPQYLCNLALHATVCALLYLILRGWRLRAVACAAAVALYALHPIGLGTALWLSDRFDLLAATLGLATLLAVQRHIAGGGWRALALALPLLLGALLAKEIGLVFAPLAMLMCTGAAGTDGRRRAVGVVALAGVVLLWWLWRAEVLPPDRVHTLYTPAALPRLIGQGLGKYAQGLLLQAGYGARLPTAARLVCGVLALAALLGPLASPRRLADRLSRQRIAITVALGLVILPALVQARGLDAMRFGLARRMDAFEVVYQMRFFYVGALGLAALLALLWDAAPDGSLRAGAGAAACAALVLVYAAQSRHLATQFRDLADGPTRQLAVAAAAATARIEPDSGQPCHIFLLDVDDPYRAFPGFTDSVVKALLPDPHRWFACTFQTEAAPWFHNLPAALPAARTAPLQPLREDGRAVRPLRIGDLEFRYFNLSPGLDAATLPGAHYLAWDGQTFHDVTAAVREGRRRVVFRCVRPAAQCAAAEAH